MILKSYFSINFSSSSLDTEFNNDFHSEENSKKLYKISRIVSIKLFIRRIFRIFEKC
jgi:hypothetical protein